MIVLKISCLDVAFPRRKAANLSPEISEESRERNLRDKSPMIQWEMHSSSETSRRLAYKAGSHRSQLSHRHRHGELSTDINHCVNMKLCTVQRRLDGL